MNEIARLALENLQRAKAYLNKDHLVRSLQAGCEGVQLTMEKSVFGQDKLQLQTHIGQYLLELSRRDDVKEYYYSKKVYSAEHLTKYRSGKEKQCLTMLKEMYNDLNKGSEEVQQAQELKQSTDTKEMLEKGLNLLKDGDAVKAKGILRRVAEAKADNPKITVMIAKAFYRKGLLREAVDICTKAVRAQPSNAKAYTIAVDAYLKQNDYENAEKWFLAAARRFGMHPKTKLRMAKLYLDWRKWSEAYDKATEAAKEMPELQKDADPILEAAGKRIFGGTGKYTAGAASGSAASAGKGKTASKGKSGKKKPPKKSEGLVIKF